MKTKDLLMLWGLAALWGASFLFIRIASPVLGPFVTSFLRVAVGALVLIGYVRATNLALNVRNNWRAFLVMGLTNAAIPFTLFAIALLSLNASYSAILNATSAFLTALVAAVWIKEPMTGRKVAGIVLGTVGVIVLVGYNPVPLSLSAIFSVGLILLATFSYGIAAVFAKRASHGIAPTVFATGQQLAASVLMLPFALTTLPNAKPVTLPIMGAVIGVGVLCTAIAYLLYYRLIVNIGPTRALTVTFLIPVFGILWGALFLGEAITPNMIVGFVIVVIGMLLVLNLLPSRATPKRWATIGQ